MTADEALSKIKQMKKLLEDHDTYSLITPFLYIATVALIFAMFISVGGISKDFGLFFSVAAISVPVVCFLIYCDNIYPRKVLAKIAELEYSQKYLSCFGDFIEKHVSDKDIKAMVIRSHDGNIRFPDDKHTYLYVIEILIDRIEKVRCDENNKSELKRFQDIFGEPQSEKEPS